MSASRFKMCQESNPAVNTSRKEEWNSCSWSSHHPIKMLHSKLDGTFVVL